MHDALAAIARLEAELARSNVGAAGFDELARLKLAAGDADGAVGAYRECLARASPSAALLNNLGAALIKAQRFGEAIETLNSALALEPGYRRALVNVGKALRATGRLGESEARLHEVLSVDPHYVPALVNLGDTLAAGGALVAAERALELAVQREPTHVEARTTLGMVRLKAGRLAAALDDLRTAIALAPDHADAHSNLGHVLFAGGDWEAAWPHFEHRFRRAAQRDKLMPPAGLRRWDGNLSSELELWLIGEQGLGDQLQFARYARLLAGRGIPCMLVCHPRLVGILSLAGLGTRVVARGSAVEVAGTVVESSAARWFPLMSLPAWHRTRADTVPAAGGYLAADPERVARWRKRLLVDIQPAGSLQIALAWAGNPSVETGPYAGRSPPLAALEPLMTVPNLRFLSLQQGVGAEQLAAVDFGRRIECFEDLDHGPDAFLDTAAVLKCVDLLITSDTAIAHLAGGLGVQTWLCLMHEPDWRWMRDGDTTAWYSSMRLFRQPSPGDWDGVYRDIAAALRTRVRSERSAHHE
jgi:tetratricopeptide (TPR) repeat protein